MPSFPSSTRILIVDDASSMRLTLKNYLQSLGYTSITEATNGVNAWTTLEAAQASFDLILSDHNMPECTGLELLRRVKADPRFKAIPFLMVTSEGEKQMIVDAIQAGAANYVTKPLDLEILKKKLDSTAQKLGVQSN